MKAAFKVEEGRMEKRRRTMLVLSSFSAPVSTVMTSSSFSAAMSGHTACMLFVSSAAVMSRSWAKV